MKRVLLGMLIFGGAALLGGCPVYPDDSHYRTCGGECCTSYDCGSGYTCSSYNQCVYTGYPDYDASAPDNGPCGLCPTGTYCTVAAGAAQCLPLISEGDAGVFEPLDASSSGDDGASQVPVEASADGAADGATTSGLCNSDSQCGAFAGSKCIDGLCTPQSQLCSDGTQCLGAGDLCIDGVCVPPCGSCPQGSYGYACDMPRGACSLNPVPCSEASPCQGGAVCVEERCVAPCGSPEAGAQCGSGQVCVNGGCIPDQRARFTCLNEGQRGGLASTCDPSSVCLHGDCYPDCNADGGGCGSGETCKQVRISSGTYSVCAPAANLGSDCNPAVGAYCARPADAAAAPVCVNGYCE